MASERDLVELIAHGTTIPHLVFQLPGQGSLLSDIPTAVIDIKAIEPPISDAEGTSSSSSSSSSSSIQSTTLAKDVVLVVDISGSMSNAMTTVKKTVLLVSQSLQREDRICIVTFGDVATIHLPLTPSGDERIPSVVEAMKIAGSTNLIGGLHKGLDVVFDSKNISANRLSLMMLLSDGEPNIGITDPKKIVEEVNKRVATLVNFPVIPQLVIHSFGFTTGHNPTILRNITTSGNGGNGLYYFLDTLSDITAAIGDCLGSVKNVRLYGMRLTAQPLGADGQPLAGWVCFFYNGSELPSLTEPPTPFHALGYLATNERRNLVVVAQPLSAAKKAASLDVPTSILARVYYCDASTREEKSKSFQAVVIQGGSSNPDVVAQQLHVQTHVLRLRVSDSLHSLAATPNDLTRHEQVHELILQTLNSVQETATNCQSQSLMEDESILLALEKDLGQALEAAVNKNTSSKDKARMQQYAHEHANQRSASNATELRATYSTPEQAQMRAQFGDGAEQKMEVIAKEEKAKLPLEEADITPEQKTKRLIVDEDVVCFVTLDNWRSSHIGLGLLVQPLTLRERYKRLMPTIEFAQDYISADAYNQGARSLATKGVSVGDRDKAGSDHSVVTSSTRGRINAWLPLYINDTNWKFVKHWAPSAFSIIATQVNDMFKPIHAIKVCAKLLNSSVVKFMSGDVHLSDRALQQYADVHRLLLEMITEHPDIQQVASGELNSFIQKPWVRGRDLTPDIGNLIQYLTVSNSVTWEDFKESYIRESFRRNTRWIDTRFPDDYPKLGPTAKDDALVEYWSEGTSVSTKLMLFNVLFLDVVAHPPGLSMDEVKNSYDKCWGRLTEESIEKLKIGAHEISKITTLSQVMSRIGMPSDETSIASLIRWAYENEKELPVPTELKRAANNETSRQIYSTFVKQQQAKSLLHQYTKELGRTTHVRSTELNNFLVKFLPDDGKFASQGLYAMNSCSAPANDQWVAFDDLLVKAGSEPLPPLIDFLATKQFKGSLLVAPSGSYLSYRASWLGVDPKFVIKEMVFTFGDTTVFVITNGTSLVSLSSIQNHFKFTTPGKLTNTLLVDAIMGCKYSSISCLSSICPSYFATNNYTNNNNHNNTNAVPATMNVKEIVISKSLVDIDGEVVGSAGCEHVVMKFTVDELKRMIPNHTIINC